jgi:transcriptional regulator with XRE-family HTH domain
MIKSDRSGEVATFAQMVKELEQSGQLYVECAKTGIAEHIHSAMKREHVSKAELARRLGKSRAYITQILQGSVNFTIETLVRVATVLNCELDMKMSPKSMVSHWNLDYRQDPDGRVVLSRSDASSQPSVTLEDGQHGSLALAA